MIDKPDVYKLEDDAPRYVIEALTQTGRPLSIDDLADNYIPPKPNDLADHRESLRYGSAPATNADAEYSLIEIAIAEINRVNADYVIETGEDEDGEDDVEYVEEVLIEVEHGGWRWPTASIPTSSCGTSGARPCRWCAAPRCRTCSPRRPDCGPTTSGAATSTRSGTRN